MTALNKNIPALRFPEFNGEWEKKKLGEVVEYVKGFAFKSEFYENDGIRIVRVSDLSARSIKQENEKIFIDKNKASELLKYALKKGDIIITTVGSKPDLLDSAVGRGIYINNENEGLLNQNMLKFNSSKNVENGFLFGYINSPIYVSHIKEIQRGNANQSNITIEDLLKYKIFLPTLPEQEKIATFLTAVDEKLQALKKKKTLLEQYKKGVMQRIFCLHYDSSDLYDDYDLGNEGNHKSGQSQKSKKSQFRQLRFKDEQGKEFPKWEVKKLGEMAEVIMGQSPNGDSYNTNEIGTPLINGPVEFSEKYPIKIKWTTKPTKFCQDKDILFCVRGSTTGRMNIANDIYCIGRGIAAIRANEKSTFKFIEFLLIKYLSEILTLTSGSTFFNLDSKSLREFHFPFPSLPEQQKIANFLSAIDEKINHCSIQIEKTAQYKKGLLQKMFC